MTARMVGWGLLGLGIFFLLRAAWLDRRLQKLRAPGKPAAAYLGPFGRWRRELYTVEGQSLIGPTRLAFTLFCIASLVGALVLSRSDPEGRASTSQTVTSPDLSP